MIQPNSHVLDLGCGNGTLVGILSRKSSAKSLGIDIDLQHVISVLGRGLDIFQTDIDQGLAMIPDNAYDYAVLSETLQVVKQPRTVLREMLRVAREGIVSFPNFAHWSHRWTLGVSGRMPKSKNLPFEWYDTPNIHLTTLKDFVALCETDGIQILDLVPTSEDVFSRFLLALGLSNIGAAHVLARITRAR